MKLIKQNKPQCLLYSFAMAFEVPPEELISMLGHDGLEVWWPEAGGAQRFRGYHYQEMIDVGMILGYSVIVIEAIPNLGYKDKVRVLLNDQDALNRLQVYLQAFNGVLVSDKHAVAWNCEEQKCYDPNGYTYKIDAFQVREFFITIKGEGNEKARICRAIQRIGTSKTDRPIGVRSSSN